MVFFDRPADTPLSALADLKSRLPLVSVIMTCRNTEPWLSVAMTSVLQQQWTHLELVVVDDGSTDRSFQIIERIAERDSRVRPFRLPQTLGTYRAKNIGMSISRGELITFMDSDDTIEPTRISCQARLLIDSNLVATTCNYSRVDSEGKAIPMAGLIARQALISLMFRRGVIADIGWFDSVRTSADDEFFERLRLVYGRHLHANVPRTLYHALCRAGSLSNSALGVNLDAADSASMLTAPRRAYVLAYRHWHERLVLQGRRPYIPFNILTPRPFPVPPELELTADSARSDGP